MIRISLVLWIVILTCVTLQTGLPRQAAAQTTGPGLLTNPWERDLFFEWNSDTMAIDSRVDATQRDTTIGLLRTRARLRITRPEDAIPAALPDTDPAPQAFHPDFLPFATAASNTRLAIGHEYTHLRFSGSHPAVPPRLVRQEIAVGLRPGPLQFGDNTAELGMVLGVGHASSDPLSDSRGWFGLATLFIDRQFAGGTYGMIGVIYDGNRSILPDVPLPIVELRRKLERDPTTGRVLRSELGISLGYPESRLVWKPHEAWTFSAGLDQLDALTAGVQWDVSRHLSLEANYGGFYDQFHVADDDPHRRHFFISQRLEAGLRYRFSERTELAFSAGYAFDQQLRRGWDLRDTQLIEKFDAGPLARISFQTAF